MNNTQQTLATIYKDLQNAEKELSLLDMEVSKIEKHTKLNDSKTKLQKSETKRYEAIQKQKEKQRKAIKDLLEHTSGNIPELYNKVNEELLALMKVDKKLELKEIKFSEETAAFRIPKFASSFNLDGATDFFGMSMAEQFMLYDRVGLFKGIVVDHSKDTPVDQGYRNAVKFLKEENNNEATKPVAIFYKKPRLSGFFETNFSLDESQRRSQQTGIFNLGFGLSVEYNYWATSAAVRAGFSYGREWLQEQNIQVKKIAITSNFFLPKIELSFDTLSPCADDSLMKYLNEVFNDTTVNELVQFERINTILMSYGHFLPTSLIIGGRLYSSDVKEIKKVEDVDNEQTQYAANFKAAFSNLKTEIGVESKLNHTSGTSQTTGTTSEKSSLTLNAIGGEGAFVNDTEKWVKSTEKFTHWGLVRFDNLVPIIEVLPKELKEKCSQLFNYVVDKLSIEELLERNAHYLFYKGYFEQFGKKAQPKFYVVQNIKSNTDVLSIQANGEIVTETGVGLAPFNPNDSASQLWYMAASGKIYSKESYQTDTKLVLSLDKEKVMVTIEDYYANQFWKVSGGKLINLNGHALAVKDNAVLTVSGSDANKASWKIVSEKDFTVPKKISNITKTLISANQTNILTSDKAIGLGEYLTSSSTNIQLKIENSKLKITYKTTKITKELYELSLGSKVQKLALLDGDLVFLDQNNEFVSSLANANTIKEVKLLDCGNLEALDYDNKIVWQSKSIIYSAIKNSSGNVLSIHHSDFEPNMSYSNILLTTMPFIGADHQLWYVNSLNQIICKATKLGTQFGLNCTNNGEINMSSSLSSTNSNVKWKLPKVNHGVIESEANNMKLKSNKLGFSLSADTTSSDNWTITAEVDYYGKSKPVSIRVPKQQHELNKDYYNLYDSNNYRFINKGYIFTNGKEIKGIKISRQENRYILILKDVENNEIRDTAWGHTRGDDYSEFDWNKLKFSKAPTYFTGNLDKIWFSSIENDKFRIKAMKDSVDILNEDNNCLEMKNEDKQGVIKYIDINWAEAKDDEKVIGFGLGSEGNRLVPYLIVIPRN